MKFATYVIPERYMPISESRLVLIIRDIRNNGKKEKRTTEEIVKQLFDQCPRTKTWKGEDEIIL